MSSKQFLLRDFSPACYINDTFHHQKHKDVRKKTGSKKKKTMQVDQQRNHEMNFAEIYGSNLKTAAGFSDKHKV